MVFGILKSSSLILNDIGYSLNEDISLKKLTKDFIKTCLKELDISILHRYINKVFLISIERLFLWLMILTL